MFSASSAAANGETLVPYFMLDHTQQEMTWTNLYSVRIKFFVFYNIIDLFYSIFLAPLQFLNTLVIDQ